MRRCAIREWFVVFLRWSLLGSLLASATLAAESEQVDFVREAGRIVIRAAERPIATYVYDDPKIPRPYFANVCAPGGIQVTRNHPPVVGSDIDDHAEFHPGIWMAFGDLSGADNWRLKARVQHVRFDQEPKGGPESGSFAVVNHYFSEGDEPQVICQELCRITLWIRPSGYLLIWDSTFSAEREFFFGDQEEMGLGFRVATPIRVSGPKNGIPAGNGAMIDAAGRTGEDQIWGKSADWCDYQGTLQSQRVGIAVFCHPDNFRPSWFHARDYGLLVANPFGRKAFRQGDSSRVVVAPQQSLRLRYGVLLHATSTDESMDGATAFAEYVRLAD
jgi:hypothetical protein